MQINIKKTANTLIEVLLVLTILGTIAALTVPGLRKYSQKTEYAQMALKGYNTINGAIDSAIAEQEDDIDKWQNAGSAGALMQNYIGKHMLKAQSCGGTSGCFGSSYKNFDGSTLSLSGSSVVTADGIAIGASNSDKTFYIDVNGPTEPNREGADLFFFTFGKYNGACNADAENGVWRLCPMGHAATLMSDNWKITYW